MASGGGTPAWIWITVVIVGGLLMLACGCGGLLFFAYDKTMDSEFLAEAMRRTQANEAAIEALGAPIEQRWGETHFQFDNEGVSFTVQIGGSEDSGQLEGRAHEVGDRWVFDELSLRVDGEWIDLLADDG